MWLWLVETEKSTCTCIQVYFPSKCLLHSEAVGFFHSTVVSIRDYYSAALQLHGREKSNTNEIKARSKVLQNIGVPKMAVYFWLRCFRVPYLAFVCCLRRLQALAGPVSYLPTPVTTLVYWDWLGWRELSSVVLCFELAADNTAVVVWLSLHCSKWFLHTLLPVRRWGVLGGNPAGTADSSWPKSNPTLWHCAIETQGKEEKWNMDFHSYYICLHNYFILSSKWLNNCPPIGNTEHIPLFCLLAHMAFAFPIKPSLSQSVRLFSLYFLSILLGRGSE